MRYLQKCTVSMKFLKSMNKKEEIHENKLAQHKITLKVITIQAC